MESQSNRHIVDVARGEAERLGHEYIGTEHILLALTQREATADDPLLRLALNKEALRAKVESIVQRGSATGPFDRPLTQRTQMALRLAQEFARQRGDSAVSPAHILVGLLREQRNIAAQVLIDAGATEERTLAILT